MFKPIKASEWQRPVTENLTKAECVVKSILSEIAESGDSAIEKYSKAIDGFEPCVIKLKHFDEYQLDETLSDSIKFAAKRIESFCQLQKDNLSEAYIEDEYGKFGYRYHPIETIGAYIPGGRYPLISSALMTLIPAKIAGVKTRIACSPSNNPAILAAASLSGATEFIQLGGAQAVAALTYGYNSIKPVNMIVGPGNQYVNMAKQLVRSRVAIDTTAGPSELLIIADKSSNIELLVADMAAQAEHDPNAFSILITDDLGLLETCYQKINSDNDLRQLFVNGQIVLVIASDDEVIIQFANDMAPEHLLLTKKSISEDKLKNYGSLFIGEQSAIALGDYCSGPNHTLPTMGSAQHSSGLSIQSFMKIQSYQRITPGNTDIINLQAAELAKAEGLNWHYKSLKLRI